MPQEAISDRYELLEELSHGGMGEVWRGYDAVLDRPVAVKLIRQASVTSPQLARAGWNYLLEQGLADGNAAGAVAIRNSAKAALQSIAIQVSGDLLEALEAPAGEVSVVDELAARRAGAEAARPSSRRRRSG